MSKSNDVFTREAQVDSLNLITKEQQSMIEFCTDTLSEIKKSKRITEASFRQLTNIWRELDSLRELFFLRILNSLKRGDILNR